MSRIGCIAWMILALPVEAADPAPIPVEDLRADLRELHETLRERHSGLDRYASIEEFAQHVDRVAAGLQPMDELAFYGRLLPLIDRVYDGHTQLSLSTGTTRRLQPVRLRLPFKLKILDRRAYVWLDYTPDRSLRPGTELLAIDGHPLEEILQRMLPLLTSDGRNETLKFRRMESTYGFGLRYRILYGAREAFELTLRDSPRGEIRKRTVRGLTSDELERRYRERFRDAEADRANAELRVEEDLAVLRLSSFESRQLAGVPYERFLEQSFRTIRDRGVSTLVLDLRGNGGGLDSPGRVLFAHLTDEPFHYYRRLVSKEPSGGWKPVDHPNLGVHRPREPRFAGDVYLLIDGGTFSAASEFVSVAHNADRVTVVGEEGAGGYYGNTSGSISVASLTHTGIRMYVPRVRYEMAVDGYAPRDRGMIPDHRVVPTIEEFLEKRDPGLQKVRELVARSVAAAP